MRIIFLIKCLCFNNKFEHFYGQKMNNSLVLNYLAFAKQKHLELFEKIASEHARIGEEQLAQRLAFEATSIRNEEEQY